MLNAKHFCNLFSAFACDHSFSRRARQSANCGQSSVANYCSYEINYETATQVNVDSNRYWLSRL